MTGLVTLAPAAADRFVKLAGMLGSDHDGEIINAARAATRVLREAGLTWRDALTQPAAVTHQRYSRRSAGPEPVRPTPDGWRKVMFCEQHQATFNAVELKFLGDMDRGYAAGRRPSEKQSGWIDRLHIRAVLADAERAA